MPNRNALRFTLVALVATSRLTAAQPTIPVRELSAPEARSAQHFGNIFAVRALPSGGVLVNDGERRQLVTLDAKLGNGVVVIDSAASGGQSYGPRPSPLIPFVADSSLFVDGSSLSLLVLDPEARIARVIAAPKPQDVRFLASSASGVDHKGNLIYRGALVVGRQPANASALAPAVPDSSPILRANFDSRTVDTLGRLKMQSRARASRVDGPDGKVEVIMTINPLTSVDEWAVLSDGSIAMIRGHDYHIDWIRPDGTRFSSSKLPFDWKRLSDADKQALVDSARAAEDAKSAADKSPARTTGGAPSRDSVAQGGATAGAARGFSTGAPTGGPASGPVQLELKTAFVPLNEIADYYPPIRSGAAKADLDGNLWILPTTSAQAKNGELIYDVINNKGELRERVRVPVGRSIAGFGRKGVVYLMHRDGGNGWLLERTIVLNRSPNLP